MRGLGAKSEEMLAQVGITDPEKLRGTGAVEAYLKVKRAGLPASLNLLWALEGALTGEDWRYIAQAHRTSLLLALNHAEAGAQD